MYIKQILYLLERFVSILGGKRAFTSIDVPKTLSWLVLPQRVIASPLSPCGFCKLAVYILAPSPAKFVNLFCKLEMLTVGSTGSLPPLSLKGGSKSCCRSLRKEVFYSCTPNNFSDLTWSEGGMKGAKLLRWQTDTMVMSMA